MKMLGKITDCENLEISQENFYDEVSFSKVTNLQWSSCNFAIKELTTASSWKMYRKLVVLKRINFEKKAYDGSASY